ncbi:hypothetical protein [Brevundimonas viscosa]|uniref:Uncharacterized protein n=1 Tax=Brevundimonas viscosa TaxID=871741 RepID=A0A1I6QDS6_9CAUL|nr:hypothetical protein [Brevundimonas viscosa]SFS50626.1 hypothetical protein SAMN05192570_1726 [Brevundimonas viscosa]
MTHWAGLAAVWMSITAFGALVAAWYGAQFWADYLKSMKLRPGELPGFWRPGWGWDLTPIAAFYTDLHRRYDSRFISGCVWTFRIAVPATGLAGLVALAARLVR